MAEELLQLLEKIQRDGVDKANAEAAAIVAKAKEEANALVKKAEEEAAATRAKAEEDAERARETISQAARDTVLKVKDDVTKLLTKLLAQDVTAALANEAVPLAAAAVKELVTGSAAAEVATAPKFVDALRAQLAAQAQDGVKVVADEMTGAGFTVKLDNGRVEHDFTDAAISGALAQRLRSDLAALIK